MTAPRETGPRRGQRLLILAAASIMVIGAGSAAVADPAPRAPVPAQSGDVAVPGGIDGNDFRDRLIQQKQDGSSSAWRRSSAADGITEKDSAGNDRAGGAQRMPRPEAKHDWQTGLKGALSTKALTPTSVAPNQEDDGAIPLARKLDLSSKTPRITTTGQIGDGPHGSKGTNRGDYDFYKFTASAGDVLTLDIDPDDGLTPQAFLYDADGDLILGGMDLTGTGNVHVFHPVERAGTYYIGVGTFRPRDPFVSGSGPALIIEGSYQLDVTLRSAAMDDTDLYAVPLRKGDVVGATLAGSARRVGFQRLDGRLLQASLVDYGAIYPKSSPLPQGGNATANYVVKKTGLYVVSISDGAGAYSATVAVRRPPTDRPRQTILLDFSAPSFDNRIFGASVVEPGIRDISPMRAFLPRWGLQSKDELAVIRSTTKLVERVLRKDIPGSNVRVVTNLTDPDAFGRPGVTRVIVGGTIEESGLSDAFGLAESIDPGNFAREETAIVMPDRMSSDTDPRSLNPHLTADSNRVQAVSQVLGYTIAHEAGHLLGNFHTDDYDEYTSVMNAGYKLNMLALGPDRVAGTKDDDRLSMVDNRYDPFQGFAGTESTPTRTWVALR